MKVTSTRTDTRRPTAALTIATGLLCLTPLLMANDADLDPAFDDDGRVATHLGSQDEQGQAVAVQNDGRIVVAGFTLRSGTSYDFAVVRYDGDGSLDAAFGNGGTVITDFQGGPDRAHAVAIQSDGGIVVAGAANQTGQGHSQFALARYSPVDGALDLSFGTGGKVLTDLGHGGEDVGLAVALQDDGKIVVAGTGFTGGGVPNTLDFALVRYTAAGDLDVSFGSNGKVLTDIAGENDYATAVALQADGKIVAAGFEGGAGGTDVTVVDFALARYTPDGVLDGSFDQDGIVTTDFANAGDRAHAVSIQADGKIVAAGFATNGTDVDFALARYHSDDGALDTSFGTGGRVTTNFGNADDRALGVRIQGDGRIIAAGASIALGQTYVDFALARYSGDGALDASFGAGGLVTTDFSTGADVATAVSIQTDGKIVAAGTVFIDSATGSDFGLARYAGPPPHTLRLYLHGDDIAGTLGGFTMNQTPAPQQWVTVNLASAPTWFSDPSVTGTFQPGATFKVVMPATISLLAATTVRLAATASDGGDEQSLGEATHVLGLGTISIPVMTPVSVNDRRLKLTISSLLNLGVNLQTGNGTYLEATQFAGTP